MQQINRVGRDGQPSYCLAFLTSSSYYLHDYFICGNRTPTNTLRELVHHIFDEITSVLESQPRAPTTMSLFAPPPSSTGSTPAPTIYLNTTSLSSRFNISPRALSELLYFLEHEFPSAPLTALRTFPATATWPAIEPDWPALVPVSERQSTTGRATSRPRFQHHHTPTSSRTQEEGRAGGHGSVPTSGPVVLDWAAEVVRYLEGMTNGCDSDAATEDGVEVRCSNGGESAGQRRLQEEELGQSFATAERYGTLDAWSRRILDRENQLVEELEEWFGDERPQRESAFRDNLVKVFTGGGDQRGRQECYRVALGRLFESSSTGGALASTEEDSRPCGKCTVCEVSGGQVMKPVRMVKETSEEKIGGLMGLVPWRYRRDPVAVAKTVYGIRMPQVGDALDAQTRYMAG